MSLTHYLYTLQDKASALPLRVRTRSSKLPGEYDACLHDDK